MSKRDYKPTPMTPEELEAQQTQQRIDKTQDTRTFQAATQAIRKIKTPSREIGFFKPAEWWRLTTSSGTEVWSSLHAGYRTKFAHSADAAVLEISLH